MILNNMYFCKKEMRRFKPLLRILRSIILNGHSGNQYVKYARSVCYFDKVQQLNIQKVHDNNGYGLQK